MSHTSAIQTAWNTAKACLLSDASLVSEGLQSVAHEILEPTGFQPVVVQLLVSSSSSAH
jgi:hypothetical protein